MPSAYLLSKRDLQDTQRRRDSEPQTCQPRRLRHLVTRTRLCVCVLAWGQDPGFSSDRRLTCLIACTATEAKAGVAWLT